MSRGALILVVGPSGAGKDSVMTGGRANLADEPNFVFPKRIVTRQADAALEDHDSMTREQFDERVAVGDCLLSWEAHGHGYLIPTTVRHEMETGKIAVCNGSRSVINHALKTIDNSFVVVITASRENREKRLLTRGREDASTVKKRLDRPEPNWRADGRTFIIENDGELADAVEDFTNALKSIASKVEAE